MNKSELVSAIASATGMTKTDSSKALNAVMGEITKALEMGDSVQITGFGSFLVRNRAAHKGRNPQTGAAIQIKASKVPAFKAGKLLKESVNR